LRYGDGAPAAVSNFMLFEFVADFDMRISSFPRSEISVFTTRAPT